MVVNELTDTENGGKSEVGSKVWGSLIPPVRETEGHFIFECSSAGALPAGCL